MCAELHQKLEAVNTELSTLQQLIEQAKQSLPTGLTGIKSAPVVKRRRPATRGSAAKRPKKT